MRKMIGQWTARQLKMQELLANPFDSRTIAEKAKEVGVSERMVYKWKELPSWQDAVYEIAKKWIGDKAPAVLRALTNKAKAGDTVAIALYLKIIGRYVEKSEIDIRAGRLEALSDVELREIIEAGTPFKGGSDAGAPEALPGK